MKTKFQLYRLHEMIPGDRFYFAGDRKKIVHWLDDLEPFIKTRQKIFWIRCGNCYNANTTIGQPEKHKEDRQVVFLRNINQSNYHFIE